MKYDTESIEKRRSIHNRIKKIIFIFVIIMLYNITLLSISYIDKFETPNNYNYKAYVITTKSMEPEIKKDDVIIIKKCKESELNIGDIITFKANGEIITHRIVGVDENGEEKKYITKGDNNNAEDATLISFKEVEGKKVLTIRYLGKIMNSLKDGIVIILVVLIFLITYLNKMEMKEKSETRRAKKKIEDKKFMGK